MKLVMTLLVRDEEDLLEANLLFHLNQGVDLIIVTDNNSVDGTAEILRRFANTQAVRVLQESDDTYSQWRWVTRMAQLAFAEHGADWVIHSDADEFWWPKAGDLKSSLARIPGSYGAVLAPRFNFPPVATGMEGPFFDRMVVRETQSFNSLGELLPPKLCHRAVADAIVEQGNHALRQPRLRLLPPPSPIVILHFPIRSFSQFENKVVNGGKAYERNAELAAGVGGTWRWLYEVHRQGKLLAYYESQLLSLQEIERGIDEGRLLADLRLRTFLRTWWPPVSESQEGPLPVDPAGHASRI